MAEEELEIEIDAAGNVTMRTHGIKGPSCMDYADLLVQILGREQTREKTSEYFEESDTVQQRIDVKQRR